MDKRKKIVLRLTVIGLSLMIVCAFVLVFALSLDVPRTDLVYIFIASSGLFGIFSGLFAIIIGIALFMSNYIKKRNVAETDHDQAKLKKTKRSGTTIFITGSIIIGIASGVIFWDLGLRSSFGRSGIISMTMAAPAYVFGVLLIAYSIHLIGCKWVWLDLPLALVINIFVLLRMGFEYQLSNRLWLLLIFPLNFAALLILFLVFNIKRLSEKPKSN